MQWLKNLFGQKQSDQVTTKDKQPSAEDQESTLIQIDELVAADVAAGFRNEADIISGAAAVLSDEFDEQLLQPLIIERTRHYLKQHALAESHWDQPTDCDRLDKAFAELESHGVVCRQDFSCCGNCGSSEILAEMKEVAKKGQPTRGYAFYHMQDTERAVVGDGVYLAYGSSERGRKAAESIAHEICARLKSHGLTTDWDGTCEKRILVKMNWKRRRALKCVRN